MCLNPTADRLLLFLVFIAAPVTHCASGVSRAEDSLSIETQVMINHVVVVGTVTERVGRRAPVSVSETIRGPDNTTWRVIWTENAPEPAIAQECLLLLSIANDGPRDELHATGHIPLDGTGVAYDGSLRRISRREDLLRAARDVGDATAPLIRLYLPHESRSDPRPRNHHDAVLVPKLRRIETHARQWLRSTDDAWRHAGISAIAHFRSPENVALLEPLLSDMSFDYTTVYYRERRKTKWKTGLNPLRERAWEVLRQWDAPVRAPTFNGPHLPHRPVNATTLLPFVAVLPLWVALVVVLRNRARRRSGIPFTMSGLVGSITIATLILCVACIAWLWRRSHHVVDEIVWGYAGAHHEIASYRGGLQYVYVPNWRWDNRVRYGTFSPLPAPPPNGVERGLRNDHPYARHDPVPPGDVWNLDDYALTTRGHRLGVEWGSGRFQPDFFRGGLPYDVVRVPYACIIAPFLVLPLLRMPAQIRRRRRLRKGLCPQCAYDLRVTPDACPECGWRRAGRMPASSHVPEGVPQVQSV